MSEGIQVEIPTEWIPIEKWHVEAASIYYQAISTTDNKVVLYFSIENIDQATDESVMEEIFEEVSPHLPNDKKLLLDAVAMGASEYSIYARFLNNLVVILEASKDSDKLYLASKDFGNVDRDDLIYPILAEAAAKSKIENKSDNFISNHPTDWKSKIIWSN